MTDRPEITKLEKKGFSVRRFSQYHYRINEQLDLFANERNREWLWHDIFSGERGNVLRLNVDSFVPTYLKRHPAQVKDHFTFAGEGWWACPMPGCAVKLRDDGSSKAAKEQAAHLEGHT
jgi:hypothetical protein